MDRMFGGQRQVDSPQAVVRRLIRLFVIFIFATTLWKILMYRRRRREDYEEAYMQQMAFDNQQRQYSAYLHAQKELTMRQK